MGKKVTKAKILIDIEEGLALPENASLGDALKALKGKLNSENDSVKVKVIYDDDSKAEFDLEGENEDEDEDEDESPSSGSLL